MSGWTISTERLMLREPRRRDVFALSSMYDAATMAAQGWTEETRRRSLIYMAQGRWKGLLLVACSVGGQPIGTVSIDASRRPPSIGLILGPHGRGQRLGLEAMRASLGYFASRGVTRLILETAVTNAPMRRIADALGGVAMTEYVHRLPNGETEPAIRYALPPLAKSVPIVERSDV